MARLGTFSLKAYPLTWFNDLAVSSGWLPQDVVPLEAPVPPPPPPPPPRPPKPRPRPPSVGGGGGGWSPVAPYWPPWPERAREPDECDDLCPPDPEPAREQADADVALLHAVDPEVGAAVRALAAGVVERVVDSKGRESIALTSDDGTRYWYADVAGLSVPDGVRVEAGQVIAHTRPGSPPLPELTPARPVPAAIGELPAVPPPAQVVFVEPPGTVAADAAIDRPRPAPTPVVDDDGPAPAEQRPLRPQPRLVRLVPQPRLVRLVPVARTPAYLPSLLRAVAPAVLLAAAAIAYALATRHRERGRRRKKKKKRPKRRKRQ